MASISASRRARPSAPLSAPAVEVHVQQQDIEGAAFAGQGRQLRWIIQRLYPGKVPLQQQPGGMQDVFIVVHHKDARVEWKGRQGHVFEIGQVSE